MSSREPNAVQAVLDPDEVDGVLRGSFFRAPPERAPRLRPARPDHYEVICISLYREDLEKLDEMVQALKKRGHRKMSRSALIRFALDHVDLEQLPKSY